MGDSTLTTRSERRLLRSRTSTDVGIGLVEMVVAMFLLATIALGTAPLLIQGAKASARNTSIAAATQIVSQQLNLARASSTSCVALHNLATIPVAPVVDSRGVTYVQSRTAGSCPSTFPALVTFTASVSSQGSQLSSASTKILVTGS